MLSAVSPASFNKLRLRAGQSARVSALLWVRVCASYRTGPPPQRGSRTKRVRFHSEWRHLTGVILGFVPRTPVACFEEIHAESPRWANRDSRHKAENASVVAVGSLISISDVAWGRTSRVATVRQSRREQLKIIPSVVRAPCTRLTRSISTAPSKGWIAASSPTPIDAVRARVMGRIIRPCGGGAGLNLFRDLCVLHFWGVAR